MFVDGTKTLQGAVYSHLGGIVSENERILQVLKEELERRKEEIERQKADTLTLKGEFEQHINLMRAHRTLIAKIAIVPGGHISLLTRIAIKLISHGTALAPLLEKALAEIVPQVVPVSLPGIEGEYTIPVLPGGAVDFNQIGGVTNPDPDYHKWNLHQLVSESSEETTVLVKKEDRNVALNRLMNPSDDPDDYLTQAQVLWLVETLKEKIFPITRAGVLFFFRVIGEDGQYELFNFKIMGIGNKDFMRFTVRRADNPKNNTLPVAGAYVVKIKREDG